MFLQETHSLSNDEQKWKDDFGVPSTFFTRKKQLFWCGNRLLWNRNF